MEEIITIKEASKILNVHPNTLRKWDNQGLLKAVRVGTRGDRRYRKEDIDRLINKTAYVTTAEEVSGVSSVRNAYYETYASLLIEKANLTSKSVVVDVPSGTGGMSYAIERRGYGGKFYHVDINEEMVASAGRNSGGDKHTFIVKDAADIAEVISERVDAVLCLNGFHIYIDRKKSFLKGCKKILKEGGALIFDVSTRGLRDSASRTYVDALQTELARMAKDAGTKLNMPSFPDDETFAIYRRKIEQIGLNLKESITFDQWKSVDELMQETLAIKGRLRPWLPDLSDEDRVEIYKQACEIAKTESGVEKINHSRVFFIATT